MLIRSQDKKKITEDLMFKINIVYINREDRKRYCSVDEEMLKKCDIKHEVYSKYGEGFGEYSTEEKAIKVLDMIQERYHDIEMSKIPEYDTGWVPFVFQMPLDSDVEV